MPSSDASADVPSSSLRSATEAAPVPSYVGVPTFSVREPSQRLRSGIEPEALGRLADSIATEGLHQPIGVSGPGADGLYDIVWGHRRLLAVRLLGWPTIPARVFPAGYDPLLASVSENIQRENLTPVEEALAIQRFLERGESLAGVTRLFRRSRAWVTGRIELLELGEDLRAAVHEGRLTMAAALALRVVDHDGYRAELVAEVERGGAPVTLINSWTAHYLADRERYIRNRSTVEAILQDREQYVVYFHCEGCDSDVPYAESQSFRLCHKCGTVFYTALKSDSSE